jgi:DNA-binding transcriptional LysR family regulator
MTGSWLPANIFIFSPLPRKSIPTALTTMATVTASFSHRHPLVTVQVLSLSTQGIIYGESGDAEDLPFAPVWQKTFVVITPRGSDFAGRSSVPWREAARLSLCLLTPNMQNRKIILRQIPIHIFALSFFPGRP